MSTINDVYDGLIEISKAITRKGGTISSQNSSPSLDELKAGVLSITQLPPPPAGSASICVAEVPNVTIKVYTMSGSLVGSATTPANGGLVSIVVTSLAEYRVFAYDSSNNELWNKTFGVTQLGANICKPNKPMNDYTWAEINRAGYYNYAEYMFNLWDFKKLASFMGSTSDTYTKAYAIGFNHDNKVGGGKAGITFLIERTSSSYKHWNSAPTNINGLSWIGSLIRQNCLKNGENYYTFDPAVTSSTSGTYYTFNAETNTFNQVTLPADYVAGTKYYTKGTMAANGAFINGLPAEMLDYIVQVKKRTWGGYGGAVTSSALATADNTIIETNDWMFCPSDSEVFGDKNRYNNYSKWALEGETYDAFKEYRENKLANSNNRWLRSPYLPASPNFCHISSGGYVANYSAYGGNYPVLCFCIGAQPQS